MHVIIVGESLLDGLDIHDMKLSMYLYYQLRMASFVLRGPFWATFPYVKNVTGYSRDYVSFFIRLADLCKCYPKLLYARVSTDSMHKYYSFIVRKIQDDRDFWSTAC